jgi:hypothetical protein
MIRNIVRVAVASMVVMMPAQAAISVTQNTNIGAGMMGFGPSTTVLDWDVNGAPGAAAGNIAIRNWIDGDGFDNGASTAFDLAINGVENVTWTFAAPVSRIGFAIATGLGLFPSEIDNLGASFNLLTSNGDTALLTLVDGGNGYAAWVEIASSLPFTSLQFTEIGTNIQDQYWGNVVASAVPEPRMWAMLVAGFGIVGAAMRQRSRHISPSAA